MLRTGNRFVREFASAKARAGWDTAKEWVLRLCLPPGRDRRTHNLPTSSTEMAMLICDSDTNTGDRGPQDLILQVHGDRCPDGRPKYQTVSSLHPSAMPLRYPLLFPAGEDGFHPNIPLCGSNQAGPPISRNREQIDNGVQLRELLDGLGPDEEDEEEDDEDEGDEEDEENGDGERRRSNKRGRGGSTRVSRSQYFAYHLHERDDYFSIPHATQRLFLEFVIDGYSQVETDRLNYIRLHQESLRLTTAQGITDAVANGLTPDQIGRSVILGSTFKNSPREITQRYQDAMACVVKYGKPSLFITVTCNPEWPEIKAALGPNDKACHRPDLIARVFEAKLNRLCDDVFGNKQRAGCFGVVLTHTHVIEYQKRGLPHAHILITLAPDDHPLSTEAIDKMISAEIPDPSRYPDLHETVTKHMLHGKCGGNSTQPCMEKDKYGNPRCKRHFPREQNPHTRMHPEGYPLYRRRFRHAVVKGVVIYNDGDCVPYSPYLCAKYNAHINVEAVTTIGAIKYLFKYVYKGPDRAVARVERAANGEGAREDEPVRDEINEFVEGRYISAPEAVHRLFGFSVGRVWPPVNRLPVHLENQQSVQINPNEPLPLDTPPTRSKLTGFFDLCAAAPDGEHTTTLLYTNVPRYYSWNKEKLRWKRRVHDRNVIGRIYTVPLRNGERFYLRLLLEVVMGPTSFADLLMFEDVVYPSYRAACAARGLLADDGEHHICLREAAQIETGDQLRRLFVFMLIHATVANPPALLDRHFASLSDDARYHIERYEDVPVNDQTIRLWTLNKIRLLLAANDRTLAFFDLPELTEDEVRLFDRLEERLPRFDRQQCAQDAEAAHARLNHDQRIASDECLCAVELDVVDQMRDNNLGPQHVFFLLAPGGTGKTFVENALLDTVRARGDQAIAVASSGVATLLLKGGHTAHSTFRIPLDTLPTSTCPVDRESDLALMLRATKLIIWDEAPMAHRFAVEAVDRLLRDLRETEEHFGGVTMIFAGDFRQCLPVVPKGTPGQIADASLIKADFWRDVRVLRLTENMRLSSNADAMDEAQLARTRDFAEWLLTVGDGTANMHPYDKIAPDHLLLPDGQRTAEGLINFVYPGLRTVNKESLEDLIQLFSRQAILAPHNATVDRINAKLLEEFNGDYIEYRSADEVVEAGETGGGMAPELISPEYLHSINPSNFPAHHLRLKEGIPVVLLRNLDPDAGLCNGTRLIVSHTNATGSRQLGFTMRRLQFPLRIALALTINKAQGQSLDRVGVDLSLHLVFTHGQLYVALSRAMSVDRIKVLLPSRDPADDDDDLQAVDRAAAAATATPNPLSFVLLTAYKYNGDLFLSLRDVFTGARNMCLWRGPLQWHQFDGLNPMGSIAHLATELVPDLRATASYSWWVYKGNRNALRSLNPFLTRRWTTWLELMITDLEPSAAQTYGARRRNPDVKAEGPLLPTVAMVRQRYEVMGLELGVVEEGAQAGRQTLKKFREAGSARKYQIDKLRILEKAIGLHPGHSLFEDKYWAHKPVMLHAEISKEEQRTTRCIICVNVVSTKDLRADETRPLPSIFRLLARRAYLPPTSWSCAPLSPAQATSWSGLLWL
ncbi:BQ5605_C005g03639 [Microbotryum silenes-dioicae]|uniref:ATP-dependent DNA helicase n=1 Tax=Microbotryum silenes-dioicae TaxID=796604 RepID=A0A2X0MFF8_9BASI|nr:BQ5605_C005g03639 [Microbotryum silenes-dioicae]